MWGELATQGRACALHGKGAKARPYPTGHRKRVEKEGKRVSRDVCGDDRFLIAGAIAEPISASGAGSRNLRGDLAPGGGSVNQV
eukprot:228591-Prorocentrum_minimum.AAC.2